MREILFRGKRLDNGEWVEGDLYHRIDEVLIKSFYNGFVFAVDPATVGQCTGMKDENGERIFEGDIVRWDAREFGSEYYEQVRWDYELLSLRENDWPEHCEIIGNIHDNPELLEGGN